MTDADLRALLRTWGRVYGPGRDHDEEESSLGLEGTTHALARGATPFDTERLRRKPRRKVRVYLDAEGVERCEAAPINISYGSPTPSGRKPMSVHPVADPIETAWLELLRADRVQAIVLRMEYCAGAIRRNEKVMIASKALDLRMTNRRYRHELELAHAWFKGRLSGARRAA